MKRIGQVLKEKRAEGYVDIVVLVLCAVLVLALAVRVRPGRSPLPQRALPET